MNNTVNNNLIIAYTDGACKGNGKQSAAAGGYGAYITHPNGNTHKIWGGEPDTTNNRMELMGAIVALQNTPADTPLQLWTDSAYVKNGITQWIKGWKNKNWRKADGKPVLNLELWQRLDALSEGRVIDWQWIKGHAGHEGNEIADTLANLGVTGNGEERGGDCLDTQSDIHDNAQSNNHSMHPKTSQTDQINTDTTKINANKTNINEINMNKTNHTEPNLAHDTHHHDVHDDMTANDHSDTDTNLETDTANDIDNINTDTKPKGKKKSKTPLSKSDFVWHVSEQNPAYDGDTQRVNPDFWAILPDPINRGRSERQLIMDTETTGFEENNGDRIVEIGIIEMVGRKFTGQKLHVYINPDRQMDDEVIRVHGISNEFVTDKPYFADVATKVYEFMKGAEIIAHNANFDMRFLNMEFGRVGLTNFSEQVQVIDTLAIAKTMYPGQKNSLDALVKRLDVGKKDRTFHGALLDSEILAEVYLAMTGGQVVLDIDSGTGDTEVHTEHENLAHLAGALVRSATDFDADSLWRQNVLK